MKSVVIALLVATFFVPFVARASPFAYVANSGDDTITVVDLVTWTVLATIPVGTQPVNVALDPSRPRVYVTNYASGAGGR
jgi:YVTN family beta-propeller protein